ncbi:hypothetical protein D6B98_20255 [Bradyrhizobium sp. LVM 105]|nr:hypothetical protein D6B98_20255 [Bradyrhizobium sp. LVM 105]
MYAPNVPGTFKNALDNFATAAEAVDVLSREPFATVAPPLGRSRARASSHRRAAAVLTRA